jgi:hypothetical protein
MPGYKSSLDTETKLYTALGFGEKQSSEPFLDSARAAAYTQGSDTISVNDKGQAVVKSVKDGKEEAPTYIDFSQAELNLPKKMDYDVKISSGKNADATTNAESAHLHLAASWFNKNATFNVTTDGKVIDGACTTSKDGITSCDETVKDTSGKTLLKGHSVTDMLANPTNFSRTTNYSDANDHPLGSVSQHVTYDKATQTLQAETTIKH